MALTLFVDTFATVSEATTVLADRPLWASSTENDKETALRLATSILSYRGWVGAAASTTQPLAWPRKTFSFYDPSYNGFVEVLEGVAPRRLTQAVSLLAYHLIENPQATGPQAPNFERLKLGPLELEDSRGSSKVPLIPSQVVNLLRPLESSQGGSNWWRSN